MGVDCTLLLTQAYEKVGDKETGIIYVCIFCAKDERKCDCYADNCICSWRQPNYKIQGRNSYADVVRKYDPKGEYHNIKNMWILDMTARIPTFLHNDAWQVHINGITFKQLDEEDELKEVFRTQTCLGSQIPMVNGHHCFDCKKIVYDYPSIRCIMLYKLDYFLTASGLLLNHLPIDLVKLIVKFIEKQEEINKIIKLSQQKNIDLQQFDYYLSYEC